MLELMNTSENAYRSFRWSQRRAASMNKNKPVSIAYVLSAHPTEACTPKNIDVFHEIQNLQIMILETAWRTPIVRQRSPKLKDKDDDSKFNFVAWEHRIDARFAAKGSEINCGFCWKCPTGAPNFQVAFALACLSIRVSHDGF
jgi:hypothetical protein